MSARPDSSVAHAWVPCPAVLRVAPCLLVVSLCLACDGGAPGSAIQEAESEIREAESAARAQESAAREAESTTRAPESAAQLAQVTDYVGRTEIGAAPEDVCRWIDAGNGHIAERFWTLEVENSKL